MCCDLGRIAWNTTFPTRVPIADKYSCLRRGANKAPNPSYPGNEKTLVKPGFNASLCDSIRPVAKVPPQGCEQSAIPHGKTQIVGLGGNAGGNTPDDLAELIKLWPRIPTNYRNQILAMVRGTRLD